MRARHQPVLEFREERLGFYEYPDLAVSAINVTTNHEERLFCVTADIVNLGGGLPAASYCVRIQILTWLDQGTVQATSQEFDWFAADATLPFRTDFSCLELQYFDEGGSVYEIDALVDVTEDVVDPNRSNNYKYLAWWPFSPNFAPGEERFRRETRTKDGKQTIKQTLGGKPFKTGKR